MANKQNNRDSVIHAAIVNNPFNLVFGPHQELIPKNYNSLVDEEILLFQRQKYKQIVSEFRSKMMENFM